MQRRLTTLIDSHKSVLQRIEFSIEKMDLFEPNIPQLKQLLLNPKSKPLEFENIKEIELFQSLQMTEHLDPWTLYLCTRHDHSQLKMIPRNVFTMIFHYLSNTIQSAPTLQDHIISVLMDMKLLRLELTILDFRLLILSFQKCQLLFKPMEILEYSSQWPLHRQELFRFLMLLCERYLEIAHHNGYELVIQFMIESGYLVDHFDAMVEFGLKVDMERYPLLENVLYAMMNSNIEIPPLLYTQIVEKAVDILDNEKIMSLLFQIYVKQGMVDPIHFQTFLLHFKTKKKYREAHLLWCYGSRCKHREKQLTVVFLPVETCLLYCDILLSQKKTEEASLVFRGMLATLPSPNRKGKQLRNCDFVDIHGQFLLLCLDHACHDLFQDYVEMIHDCQIPLSKQIIDKITKLDM